MKNKVILKSLGIAAMAIALVACDSAEQRKEKYKEEGRQFLKDGNLEKAGLAFKNCLLYTSPSPRDGLLSRMPSSA